MTMVNRGKSGADDRAKPGVKNALAAVLAVVFGSVLMWRFGSRDDAPNGAAASASTAPPTSQAESQTSPGAGGQATRLAPTPRVNLSQLIAANPFNSAEVRLREDQLSALEKGKLFAGQRRTVGEPDGEIDSAEEDAALDRIEVRAIVHGGTTPLALVGDQQVGANDVINSRWRVLSVHHDGLELEPIRGTSLPRSPVSRPSSGKTIAD